MQSDHGEAIISADSNCKFADSSSICLCSKGILCRYYDCALYSPGGRATPLSSLNGGRAARQGMVFRVFVLSGVSILLYFVFNGVSLYGLMISI